MNILRDYQVQSVNAVRDILYRQGKRSVVLQSPTGSGKCFGKDTPILMYDGSIKPVQEITIGDKIMGYDSQPRTVINTTQGKEHLYRITPVKGTPYIVNESHILSLKITNCGCRVSIGERKFLSGDIANIKLTDYLSASTTFKHVAKGWRTGVENDKPAIDNNLPPYLLGLWLGDGSCYKPAITKDDAFLRKYLENYAKQRRLFIKTDNGNGEKASTLYVSSGRKIRKNPFWIALNDFNLINNKHIPLVYKTANKKDRLELLAGLMDTDGSLAVSGYDFITINERLADDVCYLCRSLGFAAYKRKTEKSCYYKGIKRKGTYYRIFISGDCSIIPCKNPKRIAGKRLQKKDVLVTGINVRAIGVGDYYGFELAEENKLFLLGDFTVAHNTEIVSEIISSVSEKKKRAWFVVPRKELVKQSSESLARRGVPHGKIDAASKESRAYTVHVISLQTLMRRLDRIKEFPDVVFFDEAHLNYDAQRRIMRYFECAQCDQAYFENGMRKCGREFCAEPCREVKACERWKV